MAQIDVERGLDIPLDGKPSGDVQEMPKPKVVSLNLDAFPTTRFKLLLKEGDRVLCGQPIAFDSSCEARKFVSPGGGRIKEIRRGLKRRILDVIIELDEAESFHDHGAADAKNISRQDLLNKLAYAGFFSHIRQRPFNRMADPAQKPRSIFVKAIESAPYTPFASFQVKGHEAAFQMGLDALAKLTDGKVHLVYRQGCPCKTFSDAKNVQKHTVSGPHPAGNVSVHIHHIDPITKPDDCIWTLRALDVVGIGHLMMTGKYFVERVVAIAGGSITAEKRGYFRVRPGYPLGMLAANRTGKGLIRTISGDPLTGKKVELDGYLGFYDTVFCAIPECTERELLHFFRLGVNKFSAHKAYLSGFLDNSQSEYRFTTSNHGEHRGLIDAQVYDDVFPMQIPAMLLLKAVITKDFDTAQLMGLLEVDSEDFALPAFVCPSKVEMIDIMRDGLEEYAAQVVG